MSWNSLTFGVSQIISGGISCTDVCLLNLDGVFQLEAYAREKGHMACFHIWGRTSKGTRPLREGLLIGGQCWLALLSLGPYLYIVLTSLFGYFGIEDFLCHIIILFGLP